MDSAATDPQYTTIDQLHEVVPVSVKIPKILPITIEDLGKYVQDCHNNGDEELKNQYQVNIMYTSNVIDFCSVLYMQSLLACAQCTDTSAILLLTVILVQSLYDGGDKSSCDVGLKKNSKALNRFKNIIACQFIL